MASTTTTLIPADLKVRMPASRAGRWALVLAPAAAGLLALAGILFDPAPGVSGRDMYEAYGAQGDRVALKSLSLHWAYALLVVPALWAGALVHGRGRRLAVSATVLGFVGVSTMPGILFIDFYDGAIARVYGADGVIAVDQAIGPMWGVIAFVLPGTICAVLGTVLAALAFWRSGMVRWWAPASLVAALLAFNAEWTGALASAVLLGIYSLALHRATR